MKGITMKKPLFILLLWGIYTNSQAIDIQWETLSGSMFSDPFGWEYSYDIGVFDDTLMIDLDIKLEGDTANPELLNRWEQGIEETWSTNRFAIPISFNVE